MNGHKQKVMHECAPTFSFRDERGCQHLRDDVQSSMNRGPAHYDVIMEDANAKLGEQDARETAQGNYGADSQNERGQTIDNFVANHSLK